MGDKDDKYYIERVKSGSTDSFRYLVEKYSDLVFTLALRMTGNREDAQEVAQDAFVKAFQALGGFRFKSKFSSWLYAIVYNQSISFLRKKKGFHLSLDENIAGTEFPENYNDLPWFESEVELNGLKLKKALDELEPVEKFIITLYYMQDCPVKEICKITGLSASNIKIKLHRTRQKLVRVLEGKINMEVL